MSILEKIDKIREKPEHIRMRYVWGFVFSFIIVIIFIWIVSLKSNFENIGKKDVNVDKLDIMNNINENKDSRAGLGNGSDSPFVNDFNNSLGNTEINQELNQ